MGSSYWVTATSAVLVLLAGCVGSSPPASTTGASTTAAEATVGLDTGSITGRVTDQELLPVAGAEVALVETAQTTQTDAEGAFTFNDLPPGTYRLLAQRLGFETMGKKVDVVAGEVVQVDFLLQPLELGQEAYVHTVPKTILIHLGQRFTYSYTVSVANQSALNEVFCNPCWGILYHPPSPQQIMTEPEWPGYKPCPEINCDVWIYYKYQWTNAVYSLDGEMSYYKAFKSRESYTWSEAAGKTLKGKDRVMLAMHPAYYGSIEQKVTAYTSFAYNGDLPQGFTALAQAS